MSHIDLRLCLEVRMWVVICNYSVSSGLFIGQTVTA